MENGQCQYITPMENDQIPYSNLVLGMSNPIPTMLIILYIYKNSITGDQAIVVHRFVL